jgi:asparagine synthase (glutamine-hydrolysing)
MCGIAVYYKNGGISRDELLQNLNSLKAVRHRGPDGEGAIVIDTKTGTVQIIRTDETPQGINMSVNVDQYKDFTADLFIGHRRLSIIDTSINGHQPMCFRGRYWITFNGEIYNYIEVKKELLSYGYQFTTSCDTEVILASYDKWKERCVERFNGMFSILIYDVKERNLFAVNDRYGVKPLYYFQDHKRIIYMSELKQAGMYNISLTINNVALSEFVRGGYLDYDRTTMFNEIYRFRPAHFVTQLLPMNGDMGNETSYYQMSLRQQRISVEDAKRQFSVLLDQAVRYRLRSDVPLGCSLSGGLDSTSISAIACNYQMHNQGPVLNTFSVIFPGLGGDESEFVKLAVNSMKVTPHYVNPINEFTPDDFERHIYHQDFPVQSTSYYSEWCLARKVRGCGITVLLNGQGADEILAGYHHHFYRYCRQLIMSGKIVKYLAQVKQYSALKEVSVNSIHKIVVNEIILALKLKSGLGKISKTLSSKWSNANSLSNILKLDFQEYMLPTYLRSDDRDFMAFSVETRHPFLDFNLVDFCFTLPDELKIHNGWQKWLLRYSMDVLPDKIRYRRDKKGYTTPEKEWIGKYANDFNKYREYLPDNIKKTSSNNDFRNYSLGAWYKVMQEKNEWRPK